ncbi:hypothetical protein CEXT_478831 [Caerostris extrusa]|uniref:Uncharacterized protein n=1 Tax=Caerostris extrusa TaxID=172846 RepID=A0AAV4TYF9_CAEEX|nr:hypothetical protein CEXT_478831 [Caerostris extrusa]
MPLLYCCSDKAGGPATRKTGGAGRWNGRPPMTSALRNCSSIFGPKHCTTGPSFHCLHCGQQFGGSGYRRFLIEISMSSTLKMITFVGRPENPTIGP